MWSGSRRRTVKWLGLAMAGVVVLALCGVLFAWSGLYSVAASRGHWRVVEWFLEFAMRSSVRTHAVGIEVPQLDDADLVRLGAGHFQSSCADCHGAPGQPINPVAREMLPPPPPLSRAEDHWSAQKLFWIIKHGIKYTGMPAWVARERDDEVWAVVAFVRQLPRLGTPDYRGLAFGPVAERRPTDQSIALADATPPDVRTCARCHGLGSQPPASGLVPVLHGQPAEFLANALRAYANGHRRSGIMQPVATALDEEVTAELAQYYARLAPPTAKAKDSTSNDRGGTIALNGLIKDGVPPCASCHGADALPAYPRLAGQHAAYMRNRLMLWKRGVHARTDTDAIMAPIARLLSDEDIAAVSAYFASAQPEQRRPVGR